MQRKMGRLYQDPKRLHKKMKRIKRKMLQSETAGLPGPVPKLSRDWIASPWSDGFPFKARKAQHRKEKAERESDSR
jgi:hypothetical protein